MSPPILDSEADPARGLLIAHGLPLGGPGVPIRPTPEGLRSALDAALARLEAAPPAGPDAGDREAEALVALLFALAHAFPERYRQWYGEHPGAAALLPDRPSGRIVKLARVARARIAEFL